MSAKTTSPNSRLSSRRSKAAITQSDAARVDAARVDAAHAVRPPKPVLTAQFDHRVMVNFKMSSRLLTPLLPVGIELLPFRSAHYITFMASHISGVKILGLPLFPSFNAISLRTYVRSKTDPHWMGTFTLRRYVSAGTGAWLLKKHLGIAATVMPIKREVTSAKNAALPSVTYRWKIKDAQNVLTVKARSRVNSQSENSKNRWMLEHLNEFSVSPHGVSVMQAIKPNCKTYDVGKANFKCSAKRMFGDAFVKSMTARPSSVYLFNGGKTKFLPPLVI